MPGKKQTEFGSDRLSEIEGWATVHNFSQENREYLGTSEEFFPAGLSLPASSTLDEPLSYEVGYAVCRSEDNTSWVQIEDHRGETVYRKTDGKLTVIENVGPLPTELTELPPNTPYDKWDSDRWVTDDSEQHAGEVAVAEQQKAALLAETQATISVWQTELQLGIISDVDKATLITWMNYIKEVKAVDLSTAPDIVWPAAPNA